MQPACVARQWLGVWLGSNASQAPAVSLYSLSMQLLQGCNALSMAGTMTLSTEKDVFY